VSADRIFRRRPYFHSSVPSGYSRRRRFRANEARLQLSLLAYNLGNLCRRLVLPKRIDARSLTSLQQRLVKHARNY
jgi:hypothetical protein